MAQGNLAWGKGYHQGFDEGEHQGFADGVRRGSLTTLVVTAAAIGGAWAIREFRYRRSLNTAAPDVNGAPDSTLVQDDTREEPMSDPPQDSATSQ